MLDIINRNFVYKNKEVIRKLYNSNFMPVLECSTQDWAPHSRYDGKSAT